MKRSTLHVLSIIALFAIVVTATLLAFPRPTDAAAWDNPVPQPALATGAYCSYVVQRGEALYMIAARFGMSPAYLAALNHLYSGYLYAGMVLRVPCGLNSHPQPEPCAYGCQPPYPQPQPHPYPRPGYQICSYYTVQRGDWLKTIAGHFGVTWQLLAQINRLYNPNFIYAGQRLAIPCPQPYPPPPPPYQPTRVPPPYQPTPVPTTYPPLLNMVEIKDYSYNPSVITVHLGQYVQWINKGTVQHTVTQGLCPGGKCTPTPGGFDSGVLNPDGTYAFPFNQLGTFAYFCRIHGATMTGSVAVVP